MRACTVVRRAEEARKAESVLCGLVVVVVVAILVIIAM